MKPFKQPSFVDAEAVARSWLNSRTDDLVGPGNPVPLGFRFTRPDARKGATHRGAVGILSILGGDNTFIPEGGMQRARLSCSFYGDTREQAGEAAWAYLNVLDQVGSTQPVVKLIPDSVDPLAQRVRIAIVDGITGPLFVSFDNAMQYLVDVDLYFQVLTPQTA